MGSFRETGNNFGVALLAEGVDRNLKPLLRGQRKTGSPSSRRAWIEITLTASCWEGFIRRPPRGGRG